MGYLKLTSSDIRMPAKVTALPRSGDVSLRARRHAPPPANGKAHLPRADQIALSQIAQRFAPGSQAQAPAEDQRFETRPQAPQVQTRTMQSPPAAAASPITPSPVTASPRGMRTLIAVLILVALLPSALFAAMISFGAIQMTWPAPWPKTQATTWPSAPASVAGALPQEKPQTQPEPKAAAEAVNAATPSQEEPSALAADPQPRPVKTLAVGPAPETKPETVTMASTEPVLETTAQAPEATTDPETTASIAAVDGDADKEELAYDTNLIGVVSWDAKTQDLLGATGVEEVFTTPNETAPPPEHLMQAPDAPDANDDDKKWFTAPQFVNLRKGPTSSSAVISIVAKGAKLEVLGRKRGWVQVANPETSEKGWIYAGSKARRGPKRANEETADGGSFLGNLFGSSSSN